MRARTAARRHTARSSLADERRELFDSESRRFDDGTQCTAVELTVHRDSQRRSAGAFERSFLHPSPELRDSPYSARERRRSTR